MKGIKKEKKGGKCWLNEQMVVKEGMGHDTESCVKY